MHAVDVPGHAVFLDELAVGESLLFFFFSQLMCEETRFASGGRRCFGGGCRGRVVGNWSFASENGDSAGFESDDGDQQNGQIGAGAASSARRLLLQAEIDNR